MRLLVSSMIIEHQNLVNIDHEYVPLVIHRFQRENKMMFLFRLCSVILPQDFLRIQLVQAQVYDPALYGMRPGHPGMPVQQQQQIQTKS